MGGGGGSTTVRRLILIQPLSKATSTHIKSIFIHTLAPHLSSYDAIIADRILGGMILWRRGPHRRAPGRVEPEPREPGAVGQLIREELDRAPAEEREKLLGYIERHTCELNGANPFDYLTDLQRHAEELKQKRSEWCPGTTARRRRGSPKSANVFSQQRTLAKMFRAGMYARVSANDQQTWRCKTKPRLQGPARSFEAPLLAGALQ